VEAALVSLISTGVPQLELTGARGLTRRTHATNGGPAGQGCVYMTKCMNLLANSMDFNRVWIDFKGKFPTFTLL
jgi:hypothetical protein